MKLTVTYFEAAKRIADIHNVPPVDVQILPLPTGHQDKPQFPIHEAVLLVRRFRHRSDEKIAAIKAVREFGSTHGVSIGLAEAKLFVEAI